MKKLIDTDVSFTARMVCLKRAISYFEPDPVLKCGDRLAEKFLPPFFAYVARHHALAKLYLRAFVRIPKSYEYVVARTKLVDRVFARYAAGVEQVVIFGAGFDSRAIRFAAELRHAVVFELDSEFTQREKRGLLFKKKVPLPANLRFVPLDLNGAGAAAALACAGFEAGKPTLFLLEGLTMYLDRRAIDEVFGFIGDSAGAGSVAVFDYLYAAVLRRENLKPEEERLLSVLDSIGERFSFGLERGGLADFLGNYGLEQVADHCPRELAASFLAGPDGMPAAETLGIYGIAIAEKTAHRPA